MRQLCGTIAIAFSIVMYARALAGPLPSGTVTVVRLPIDYGISSDLGLRDSMLPMTAGRLCGSMIAEFPAWLPSEGDRPNPAYEFGARIIGVKLTWPDGKSLEIGSGAGALSQQDALTRTPSRWDDLSLRIDLDADKRAGGVMSRWNAEKCGYFVRGTFDRAILQHILDTFEPADDQMFGRVFFASPNNALMQTIDGMEWRSLDGGASWQAIINLRGEGAQRWFDRYADGSLETAEGDGNLVRSTDGGASWSALHSSDLAYDSGYGAMTRPSIVDGLGYALSVRSYGSNPTTQETSLVRSDKRGLRWRRLGSPPQAIKLIRWRFAPQLFVIDRNHMVVAWNEGCTGLARLWSTFDAGKSWRGIASPGVGLLALGAVKNDGLDIEVYDRCALDGGILESSDGGSSWHRHKLPQVVTVVAGRRVTLADVSMADASFGGASGSTGAGAMELVTADGGGSWHDVTPTPYIDAVFSASCEPKPRRCMFTGLNNSVIIWQAQP